MTRNYTLRLPSRFWHFLAARHLIPHSSLRATSTGYWGCVHSLKSHTQNLSQSCWGRRQAVLIPGISGVWKLTLLGGEVAEELRGIISPQYGSFHVGNLVSI